VRKIFGSMQNENGSWRIRKNYELNELTENVDIKRFVKTEEQLGCHVMRMDDKRTPKRVLKWKPIRKRIRGRPKNRWIEGIEKDMQIMGIRQWRKQFKERAEWKRITEKARTQSGFKLESFGSIPLCIDKSLCVGIMPSDTTLYQV
jgi:hypothetical protein